MRTFSVKNFERFQHYKDRSPIWIRLYNALLDDYEFSRLPDASKAHLIAIWLLASRYSNKIPYDNDWIFRRINATSPVDIDALAQSGFIIVDQDCSETLASCEQRAMPEKRREEKIREEKRIKKEAIGEEEKKFDAFWEPYPLKVGKKTARSAFGRALLASDFDTILDGLARYKRTKPADRHWMHPATFLNGERWNDEPTSSPTASGKPRPHDAFFRAVAQDIAQRAGDDERPADPDDGLRPLLLGQAEDTRPTLDLPPTSFTRTK